jgi:RNA polymerase sigma-54 factor
MNKSLSLNTEMRMQQKLTPLQVQFVRMLEMTGPELEDEVQRALDEMPALEAVDTESHNDPPYTEDGQPYTESGNDMQRADFRSDDDVPDYLNTGNRQTEDVMRSEFSSLSLRPLPSGTRQTYDPSTYIEPIVTSSGESLIDTLSAQLSELTLSDEERKIALYLIGSIDDNGYMTRSIEAITDDLAINENIITDTATVNRLWQTVRQFEPAGVAATDLRDCLLLQLQRLPRTAETVTATKMLEDCFDLFSRKHFEKIAQQMGITIEDVKGALSVITRLNPKPAAAFAASEVDDRTRHITPDFTVEPTNDGKLTLTLINNAPELRVEATFADDSAIPQGSSRQLEEARMFTRRKRDDARNFIKVIQLRQETLFRVMSAIVKLQHKFFLTDDDEDIRPMVLRDIAELTGYNLSVISRATQGKYVATLRGVYPLKKFFNEKVRDDDDTVTANRIIAAIKSAIEHEDASAPLSDRSITEMLAAKGFDIARRTVAKYRENLGFPVARLRKRI